MAELPPASARAGAAASGEGGGVHPGMPRWVKAAIVVVLVVVVVLVIGKLAGVEHGPGMHGGNGQAPASEVSDDGTTPSDAGGPSMSGGAGGHRPPPGADHGAP